jgi:deoxyribodipyrimidine photo-lyase
MQKKIPVVLFWFRRDLRLHDNTGLYHALQSGIPVLPVFIFDKNILSFLNDKADARVSFIYETLQGIHEQLLKSGSGLSVHIGKPEEIFAQLLTAYQVQAVYTNHDYESYPMQRDERIKKLVQQSGAKFYSFKDHVIFEKSEILSDSATPYKVYTPYKKKWIARLEEQPLSFFSSEKYLHNFYQTDLGKLPSLSEIGFEKTKLAIPAPVVAQKIIKAYDVQRDYPALEATSRLGIHFRFGTISLREKVKKAQALNAVWLSELVWREFFIQLMFHFPHVAEEPFQPKFKRVQWRTDEGDFALWCSGHTGYPLVDAGMRELNATGHMHNRVRMVVASFLTKHLLIDWRWGEAYFAEKLLDFEMASNNGNWQWCAGTGADAQPYFRIFNPIAQQQKFDPDFVYIKKWIPEWNTAAYPKPMIEHKEAVARAKNAFGVLQTG